MRVLLIDEVSEEYNALFNVYEKHGIYIDVLTYPCDCYTAFKIISYAAVIYIVKTLDMSVLSWVDYWRKNNMNIPILIVTMPTDATTRASILNAGADDCLQYPAAPEEIVARVRAILRRRPAQIEMLLRHKDIVFDICKRVVTHCGKIIKLTAKETAILELLLLQYPRILTRRYLDEQLCTWHRDICSNSAEVHICNLRRKLGRDVIETVRGQGYRLQQ